MVLDEKLKHASAGRIFEYMYVVLSFIRGPWLIRAPNFVMLVMPELFSGYVIDLRLSC
jgi:hypothetical protein